VFDVFLVFFFFSFQHEQKKAGGVYGKVRRNGSGGVNSYLNFLMENGEAEFGDVKWM